MQTYTEAEAWLQAGRDKDRRKVANNTYLHRLDNGDLAVQLHATDVVTYHPDGSMTLRTGGYQTVTTKDRLNGYTPYRVASVKGRWFISAAARSATMDIHIPFVDGIRLDPSKPLPTPADTSAEDAANKAMNKAIDKYVKGYTDDEIKRLYDGAVTSGRGGDCWFCLMFDAPQEDAGNGFNVRGPSTPNATNPDHLIEHMTEGYRLASLMLNAVVAKGYVNPSVIMSFSPDSVRSAIRSYLRKRLVSGVVATR